MNDHTCKYCNGKRTYEVRTRKMHGGARCGSEITLLYPCNHCHGSGIIRCDRCEDTGYEPEYDTVTGEYEGTYPCLHCDKGKRMAELDRIDAEKDAWERSRPRPAIDLDAIPF